MNAISREEAISLIKANLEKNDKGQAQLVAIAGGSCSGKTTFASMLAEDLASENYTVTSLSADDYYKDFDDPTLPSFRGEPFYDHPDALHVSEMLRDLERLAINREYVEIPVYSIPKSKRQPERVLKKPSDIVIIEGLFVLDELAKIKTLLERRCTRVFMDAPFETRLGRRKNRDISHVGSAQRIEEVFTNLAEHGYQKYCLSQKEKADVLISTQ
jgi:uridine kinase